MWKLTIEDDEGKQTSLPLAHEEYGLGRAETNAIRLTDRNVSRTHALLKKNGQGWFLKDLQSYNGTYVNGVRVVGEQLVHSGDVVQLGDYRLELVDDAAVAQATDASSTAPAAPAPIHQRPNRLVVVVGPTPGAEYPLDRDHFTIGRSEEATISINHSSVSRVHAEVIAIGNGRFEIVDKGSANGIRINGVELKRGILEAGDALELGDVRLRFVGAGKIYKAFTDQTAQVHPAVALGGFESVAHSVRAPAGGARSGPSIGKLIGIGALVGVLAIALFVFVTRQSSGGANAAPQSTAHGAAPASKGGDVAAIADAKSLLAKKDYDGAHKRVLDLPDSSPLRDDPAVRTIEGAWADYMFAKADQATDHAEKRRIWQQINFTPTVDPDRRKRAADLIQAMDAAEPPPPEPANNGAGSVGGPRPSTAVGERPEHERAPTVAKGSDPAPVPTPAQPPLDPNSEEAQMKALMPRVFSGRASENEIKMLKALCAHLGNHDCRDRAAAMLKKKQEGQ
ncbi:MAG TPA: FHA domain-containing protein [Minicystis sp.]|nr:FHA domain-containing protein [Minicystis sp.]